MKKLVSLRTALGDPQLLGTVLAGPTWAAWRTMLIAAMGEELTPEERVVFTSLTGRDSEPLQRVDELRVVAGRRAGKSRAVATLAAYIASLVDFSDVLAPGERASLPIMSASTWQAGKLKQFLDGIFESVQVLRSLKTNETSDTISLSTSVDIEIRPASFRTSRGGTCAAVICDEIAFWRTSDNSQNPDSEILAAIRPALSTTGGMLACISSPYARRGELWNAYRRDYGPEGDKGVLIAKAASRELNPTLSEAVVARAYDRDPATASAEFGGEFRSDIESFISREVVDASVVANRFELPPASGVRYVAFVDPSGGSSDDMTICIAHSAGDAVIIDAIRAAKPPFSPDTIVSEFAALMKAYGVSIVTGDRYGGEWPRERFRVHGIRYEPAEKTMSDLYRELLPLLNAGRVTLLDHQKLVAQLCGLERRTARGGRDSIDHAPGAHDDVANCVAGAAVHAVARQGVDRLDRRNVARRFTGGRWQRRDLVRGG